MKKIVKSLFWIWVTAVCLLPMMLAISMYATEEPYRVTLIELRTHPREYMGRRVTITGRVRWISWEGMVGRTYIPLTERLPHFMTGNSYDGIGFGGSPIAEFKLFDPSVPMPNPKVRHLILSDEVYNRGVRVRLRENEDIDFERQEPLENSITEFTGHWKKNKGQYYLDIEHFVRMSTEAPHLFNL